MKAVLLRSLFLFIGVSLVITASASDTTRVNLRKQFRADPDNGGLKLQKGFGAVEVISELGKNRHLVVNSNGDIYVKLARLKDGKGILVLHDKGDGKLQVVRSFGNYIGTGIAIKNGYLYASSDNDVFR